MKTNANTPPRAGHPGTPLRRLLAFGTTCATACLAVLALAACQDMNPPPAVPSEAYQSKPSGTLAPGDELSVNFSGAPELNTKQKIQPNGKVSLPTVGDVVAAGRTINSLQASLTSLYQPHLQDPTVVVGLEAAAAGVYVSGEVLRPGKVPLDRPMSALEAIMESGGFSRFANPKQVIVIRKINGKQQRYVLNMKDTLAGYETRPFYLRPYDVIYVKQSVW